MAATITADVVKKADYQRMLQLYKESVANPADYTLLFTGNVDIGALKPLLEQYIASLPSSKKRCVRLSHLSISPVEKLLILNSATL